MNAMDLADDPGLPDPGPDNEVEEEEEVDLTEGFPSGGGGGRVSYEDEEVNRALVDNIKEKINKLEETVSFGKTYHRQH